MQTYSCPDGLRRVQLIDIAQPLNAPKHFMCA